MKCTEILQNLNIIKKVSEMIFNVSGLERTVMEEGPEKKKTGMEVDTGY